MIKPEILNDSILCFAGAVDENDSSRFSDHSELLSYVRSRLLPACDDKPRGYHFVIDFNSEKSAAKCVITSLLQMPQIKCCSCVQIGIYDAGQMKLPVKEISSCLHRNCDSHRILHIYSGPIANLMEMFNHLKEVIVSF